MIKHRIIVTAAYQLIEAHQKVEVQGVLLRP